MRINYGMGRPKGLAKTGDRKPGTPNKNSVALIESSTAWVAG